MHPEVRDKAIERVHGVFNRMETRRGVLFGKSIRSFVEDLVLESLQLRDNEWRTSGLDPMNRAYSDNIAAKIEGSLTEVAEKADTYKSATGAQHVLLIGIVEQIHSMFCGIFPFCR
jgi:hypothetical protein